MKKCILAIFMVLLTASVAFGADSLGAVIKGVVADLLEVSGNTSATVYLDVFNTSETNLGTLTVLSNLPGRWHITLSSNNGGHMAGATAGNTDVYPYTLRFGDASNISLSRPYTIEMSGKTIKNGAEFPIGIAYRNFWDLDVPVSPDTYTDTITIDIFAF